MSQALVSVIVPIHNGADWIRETLDSIFSQTHTQLEIILIDDASTDQLDTVIKCYSDPRLRVEHLDHNIGVSAARNYGIQLANGQFIAFCDADDICEPERFERQLAFLGTNLTVDLCGTAFTCFDEKGNHNLVAHPLTDAGIHRGLMRDNCFGLSTVMARSRMLKKYAFDETLRVAEDYELWTRLAADKVELANLPNSLVRYRLHEKQASDTYSSKLDDMTRKVRARYCAHLLHSKALQACIQNGDISIEDIYFAAATIKLQSRINPTEFRFMLAWMYQQLPSHRPKMLYRWMKIQRDLNLDLDSNYLINVTILACLPKFLKQKYFSTLIKLKR